MGEQELRRVLLRLVADVEAASLAAVAESNHPQAQALLPGVLGVDRNR